MPPTRVPPIWAVDFWCVCVCMAIGLALKPWFDTLGVVIVFYGRNRVPQRSCQNLVWRKTIRPVVHVLSRCGPSGWFLPWSGLRTWSLQVVWPGFWSVVIHLYLATCLASADGVIFYSLVEGGEPTVLAGILTWIFGFTQYLFDYSFKLRWVLRRCSYGLVRYWPQFGHFDRQFRALLTQ